MGSDSESESARGLRLGVLERPSAGLDLSAQTQGRPDRRRTCKCAGAGSVSQTRTSGRTNDRDSHGWEARARRRPPRACDSEAAGCRIMVQVEAASEPTPHESESRHAAGRHGTEPEASAAGTEAPNQLSESGDSESSFKFSQSPATLRKLERVRAHRDRHPGPAAASCSAAPPPQTPSRPSRNARNGTATPGPRTRDSELGRAGAALPRGAVTGVQAAF